MRNKIMLPKTQKAKGILDGIKVILYKKDYLQFFSEIEHKLIQNNEDIVNNDYLPSFARPCPITPRHGFVDSEPIFNNNQLKKLFDKVKLHDSGGEIILGPYYPNIIYNAVYVNSGILSIGLGNDGATGGNDSIGIPVCPYIYLDKLKVKSEIKEDDAVYIESVYPVGWDRWGITQVRGGPKIESVSPDFIPKKIRVEYIETPLNDLIKWETRARNFKPGTVVYGEGHTLASHAAIHCVINNIPFVTSFKPVVGKILEPTKKSKPRFSRDQFRYGVNAAINICEKSDEYSIYKYFYYSLSILHNWAYIKHSEHAGWLLGSAAMIFIKLCSALVIGEHRHFDNGNTLERDEVYSDVLRSSVESFYRLPKIFEDFYYNTWEDGFGGIPWATCALFSHKLWNNIVKLYNFKRKTIPGSEVSKVISIINKVVNLAHNNGWWFNKIAFKRDLDFIAWNPGMAAFCVSHIFIRLHKEVINMNNIENNLNKTEKIYMPSGKDSHGNVVWVKILGAYHNTEVVLIRQNEPDASCLICLNDKEVKYLRKKYKNRNYNDHLVLQVRSGMFAIPGGRKRNINRMFRV